MQKPTLFKSYILKLLVVFLTFGLLFLQSCNFLEVGIGPKPDIQGPSVKILSHFNQDFIKGSFTLRGQASDNVEVRAVRVSLIYNRSVVFGYPQDAQIVRQGGTNQVDWSLKIDTSASGQILPDGEYQIRVLATDAAGNSTAESVAIISVIVDNQGGSVNINQPSLQADPLFFSGLDHRNLENLPFFQNGIFRIRGNVDENFGLAELRFRLVCANGIVVYERILERGVPLNTEEGVSGNLWNFSIEIDGRSLGAHPARSIDLSQVQSNAQGQYLLQVQIRAVDQAGNVEETNQGYLAYFPDSDRPWVRVSNIRPADMVPASSQVAGNAFDDDGVQQVFLLVQKRGAGAPPAPGPDAFTTWASLIPQGQTSLITADRSIGVFTTSGEASNVYSWSLSLPSDAGEYILYVQTRDVFGTSKASYATVQFSIQDQDLPVTSVTTPLDYSEILQTNFTMNGYSYDDSGVASLFLAWVPSGANAANLLVPGPWNLYNPATLDSRGAFVVPSSGGIRIWKINLGTRTWDPNLPVTGTGRWRHNWSRSFDVASDLAYGDLNFVLRAVDDAGNASYTRVAYLGDRTPPVIQVTNPPTNGLFQPSSPSNPFRLEGTWSDNSDRIDTVRVRWVEGNQTVLSTLHGSTWRLDMPFAFPDGANNLEISGRDHSGNTGFALRYMIIVNDVPVVGRISSSNPNGFYRAGEHIDIQVEFNQPVVVTGSPRLALNTGGSAQYTQGSDTTLLTFRYTVDAGHNTSRLNYASTGALSLNGGTLRDRAGNNANLTLPALTGPLSLASNKDIRIDTTNPTILSVNSATSNGHYRQDGVVSIQVQFSEIVLVEGTPTLRMNTNVGTSRNALYSLGSGTNTLSFTYTIQSGDNTIDLDVFNTTALSGTIQDLAGNAANLNLPVPGSAGSLGANKNIAVDTVTPLVPSIGGITAGAFSSNRSFTLVGLEGGAVAQYSIDGGLSWISYSAMVVLNTEGTYRITARQSDLAGNLSPIATIVQVIIDTTPPAAPFVGGIVAGAFSTDQTFTISGEPGASVLQFTTNNGGLWQNYTGPITLSANGTYNIRARQTDVAGNASLESGNIQVIINKVAPIVTGVTSPTANGHYRVGGSVTVTVTFNNEVYVTGAPRILLNSGATAFANYASGTGTTTLSFTYFVSAGENSSDLDYASSLALQLHTGSIRDLVGNNAVLALPNPGSAGSLGANKALVIDTTAPVAPTISGLTSGTFNTDRIFTISGEFGASIEFSSDNGLNWVTYNGTSATVSQGVGSLGNYVVVARQTDVAGNRGPNTAGIAFTIDRVAPVVTSVSASTPNGEYRAGSIINIQVNFSKVVNVTGSPQLALNTSPARIATFASGSGTSTLVFSYTVSANDLANRLDYATTTSLSLNGGTIRDTIDTGNTAVLTLAAPGAIGSLGFNRDIRIDAVAPTITTYTPAHDALNVNANGSITLSFSEPVFRESGNITIKRVVNSLPLVLTVAQYSEFLSRLQVLGNPTNTNAYVAAYRLTTNGVLGGGLPDPSPKYVLDYNRGFSDAILLPIFETLGYNDRLIMVDSTQVSGSGTNSIVVTPAGGLPIGIEYYVTISPGAFRDSAGNNFAGITTTTTYRFTTGPVATPVVRVHRISNSHDGATTALTTTFRIDVETVGASIVYSMPGTSTVTDSDADYANPVAVAPSTFYSAGSHITLGDAVFAKGWRYYIQAQATRSGFTASAVVGERAYRTVLSATQPWFRGSNNSGGPTTAPGFPLRWEDNAVGYIRRGIQSGGTGNFFFITWEVSEFLHFKALAGGAMNFVTNPAGFPAGTYEAGPASYGWGSHENRNVHPGGFRFANHLSYETLADRRGAPSTWIFRPLGQ